MPIKKIILPDFIIIGANKAGTTSVANYLTQHPEIKISKVKEPMFFSSDPYRKSANKSDATLGNPFFAVTLDEYSEMYEEHGPETLLFGEASTSYMANPILSSKLIKKIVPDVKIIAILREPSSRALSAYKMCFGNGVESKTFKQVVQQASGEDKILAAHSVKEYIRNGLYSQLLRSYTELFDKSNLFFTTYDSLVNDSVAFMNGILEFIGASSYQLNTNERMNTAEDNLSVPIEVDEQDLRTLRAFYLEDILKTESMTGLDLSGWKN